MRGAGGTEQQGRQGQWARSFAAGSCGPSRRAVLAKGAGAEREEQHKKSPDEQQLLPFCPGAPPGVRNTRRARCPRAPPPSDIRMEGRTPHLVVQGDAPPLIGPALHAMVHPRALLVLQSRRVHRSGAGAGDMREEAGANNGQLPGFITQARGPGYPASRNRHRAIGQLGAAKRLSRQLGAAKRVSRQREATGGGPGALYLALAT